MALMHVCHIIVRYNHYEKHNALNHRKNYPGKIKYIWYIIGELRNDSMFCDQVLIIHCLWPSVNKFNIHLWRKFHRISIHVLHYTLKSCRLESFDYRHIHVFSLAVGHTWISFGEIWIKIKIIPFKKFMFKSMRSASSSAVGSNKPQ